MAKINIYLSRQPSGHLHEIYREGKPTGEMIDNKTLMKILTPEQYSEFINGEQIFFIEGETFRTRKHKEKTNRLSGRSHGNFKF